MSIVISSLVIIYISGCNSLDKYSNLLDKYLGDDTYVNKIENLELEYDELINNVNSLINDEIDDLDKLDNFIDDKDSEYRKQLEKKEELVKTKNSLTEQKNTKTLEYNKLVNEANKKKQEQVYSTKNQFIISNVAKINQYSIGYPTGCESVALTILLNFWGVNVSANDVVAKLPMGRQPYYENGIKYGGNPYIEFVGNPSNPHSYGVYDAPIRNMANSFKSGIISGNGKSLDEILNIVSQNRPVLVWSSMYMAVPYIGDKWIYKETGETIKWLSNLHAIVIIGYNDSQVITSDTLTGTVRYYNRKTFENRYIAFGKRALYY